MNTYNNIEAQGTLAELPSIPIWIDISPPQNPATYENLFWEVEPMAEYLFYLAGDYLKTDMGLLRFTSALTSFRVEVTHEPDSISVVDIDGRHEQLRTQEYHIPISNLAKLSLDEVIAPFLYSTKAWDDRVGFIDMGLGESLNTGRARCRIMKPHDRSGFRLELRFERLLLAPESISPPMLIQVLGSSSSGLINFSEFFRVFLDLVTTYRDMPYRHFSGAIRL